METSPDTQPVDDAAPPKRSWRGVCIVWILIALLTAGMYVLQAASRVSAVQPTHVDPAQQGSPMLRIMGQLGLGMQAIFNVKPGGGPLGDSFGENVRDQVLTPVDRVRAAPLLAELEGAAAGIVWLDEIIGNEEIDESLRIDAQTFRDIYESDADELTSDETSRLVARHGWFARIALVYGKDADDPQRRSLIEPAVRAAVAILAVELGGLITALVGFGLLIWVIVWLSLGKVTSGYRKTAIAPSNYGQVFLETLAVLLIAMPVMSWVADWFAVPSVVHSVMTWLLVPIVLWPRLRGATWAQWRTGLGWHAGRGVFREIGAGLFGYLAALPVLLVVILLIALAVKRVAPQDQPMHPIIYMADGANFWRILGLYAMACVWAPLVEESVFRGALYHHLRQGTGIVLASLISAFIFAIIHPQGLLGVPAIMTLGVIFALIREWRGSVIASATAHAFNNFLVTTLLLVMLA